MSEFLANENGTLAFILIPPVADFVYSGNVSFSDASIVKTLDGKVKLDSKFLLVTNIGVVWTEATGGCPYTSVTHIFVAGGGSIAATSVKCRASGQIPLRANDTSEAGCNGSWTSPGGANVTCHCFMGIAEAGQNKVKGE